MMIAWCESTQTRNSSSGSAGMQQRFSYSKCSPAGPTIGHKGRDDGSSSLETLQGPNTKLKPLLLGFDVLRSIV